MLIDYLYSQNCQRKYSSQILIPLILTIFEALISCNFVVSEYCYIFSSDYFALDNWKVQNITYSFNNYVQYKN